MKESAITVAGPDGQSRSIPLFSVHTLVLGSGAAGLNAAVQLRANGVEDVVIVTEGLDMGTSINTGSDKQTYYKLSMCGAESDAPAMMAQTYFDGGSMHGDLSLVEASLSARAFLNLVNLGVPFPRDEFGQFVGYKTDHDPRQRATSIGPYTSREMCRTLIRRVKELGIPVREGRQAAELLITGSGDARRAAGIMAANTGGGFEAYVAENIVFAVGGPGGIYRTSVYPHVHTGAIGLALRAGVMAQGLPESQYGLASTAFRWNVSGTYMQVVPRFMSTDADGKSNEREFLNEYFDSAGAANSNVFLKGYQWPFDSRKAVGGSSIVDIIVYVETVLRGRRVFLDFRRNPDGFSFDELSPEARTYLEKSGALLPAPIERLAKMNPGAVQLYADHGIDITREPLEVAVCAQHNNGGLAGNHWWESVNTPHLFPIGEVNGSHGVYRPGGSALNSGQVAGFRAAEYIANRCMESTLDTGAAARLAAESAARLLAWAGRAEGAKTGWRKDREEFQARMSRAGAHIRKGSELEAGVKAAWEQVERIEKDGSGYTGPKELLEALKNRHLAFAHAVYLEAVLFAIRSGAGSRGSAIVIDPAGKRVHPKLSADWTIAPEDESFREKVQETSAAGPGRVENRWVPRRPLPRPDSWFETSWARFNAGAIYGAER
ncbi:MAG: FAD-binding protein [Lentisphaerae bacterium]|nr:FAD-binding protein [Lentisphaerota bacterium]